MKKCSALPLVFLLALRLSAQLPPGAIAPDFSAQDIAGHPWHLFDILDQGKIVVLEVGATWCAPCWAYHNSHALQEFYEAHGPAGDDKAQVFFIESDPETNTACFYDEPGCNDFTPGNWVEGTTYPYINDAAIADSFAVEYLPTIFVICPNKKTYQIGQFSASKLWEKVSGCPVAYGVNNAGVFDFRTGSGLREVCDTLRVQPSFTLVNLGSNPLTAAAVSLQWNNNPVQTKQWSGYLPLYSEATVVFDSVPLDGAGTLKTTLASVNNAPGDDDSSNNVRNENFSGAATFKTKQINLKIKTDDFGAETYWEIRDERDSVLFHGGNEAVGANGGGTYGNVTVGPGAYGNNVLINKTLTLPGDGCYSILFVDAYGDGMCCDYGNGFFRLYNGNNPAVPVLSGGEFEASILRGFSVASTTETFTAPENFTAFRILPNPADNHLQVAFHLYEPAFVSLSIFDARGRLLYEGMNERLTPGEHIHPLSVESWPGGMYFARLQAEGQTAMQEFVVER